MIDYRSFKDQKEIFLQNILEERDIFASIHSCQGTFCSSGLSYLALNFCKFSCLNVPVSADLHLRVRTAENTYLY